MRKHGTWSLWRRWRPTGCVTVLGLPGFVPFFFRSTVLFAQRGFGYGVEVPKPNVNWPRPKIWRTQEGCVAFSANQTGAASLILRLEDFYIEDLWVFFSPIFFALRETNFCKPSSVVSATKFPTYRTAFFNVGFFQQINKQTSRPSYSGSMDYGAPTTKKLILKMSLHNCRLKRGVSVKRSLYLKLKKKTKNRKSCFRN